MQRKGIIDRATLMRENDANRIKVTGGELALNWRKRDKN